MIGLIFGGLTMSKSLCNNLLNGLRALFLVLLLILASTEQPQ